MYIALLFLLLVFHRVIIGRNDYMPLPSVLMTSLFIRNCRFKMNNRSHV